MLMVNSRQVHVWLLDNKQVHTWLLNNKLFHAWLLNNRLVHAWLPINVLVHAWLLNNRLVHAWLLNNRLVHAWLLNNRSVHASKKHIVHWRQQPGNAVDAVQGINDCLFLNTQETHQCIVRGKCRASGVEAWSTCSSQTL